MMRSTTLVFLGFMFLASMTSTALAAGDEPLHHVSVDVGDRQSLQRGARLFVNYCMGCHAAEYMRYNRLGKDLGISEDILERNLIPGSGKASDTMEIVMSAEQAEEWFNAVPPDLTLVARSRGADWLYSYLLTFYHDPESPTGFNNLQFKGVSMPHVLWELQGIQRLAEGGDGHTPELKTVVPGSMSDVEYRRAMRDLVNFMVYLSEPARMQRYEIGFWVIFYLLILLVIVYLLKKEYWRDVH